MGILDMIRSISPRQRRIDRVLADVDEGVRDNIRADAGRGWRNPRTGQGGCADPSAQWQFEGRAVLTWTAASLLYSLEKLAARIVDRLPDDATREPPALVGEEFDLGEIDGEAVLHRLGDRGLDLWHSYNVGLKWARTYGGAGLWVRILDGADEQDPIDWRSASVVWEIVPVPRADLEVAEYDRHYRPRRFWLSRRHGGRLLVHRERLVPIYASELPPDVRESLFQGWGPSELDRIFSALSARGVISSAIQAIVSNASLDVVKFPQLGKWNAEGQREAFQARIDQMDAGMRTMGKVILAAGEDYVQVARAVSGLGEIMREQRAELRMVSGLPAIILEGDADRGLSTGENAEVRMWYDDVRQFQTRCAARTLTEVIEVVMRAPLGPSGGAVPEGAWGLAFASLWQPDAKTLADTRKVHAEARALDISAGVLEPDEARRMDRTLEESYDLDLDGEPELGQPGTVGPGASTAELERSAPWPPPGVTSLTPANASKRLGGQVSATSIRGMAKRGEIRSHRVRSGRLLIAFEDIFRPPGAPAGGGPGAAPALEPVAGGATLPG